MSEQNALFRKAALDKLSSPERLDVLMAVTSPRSWVALVTVAALLGGFVWWSIYGIVENRVDGQGILIRGGALRELRATSEGTLTKLNLAKNGTVTIGDRVGVVEQVTMEAGVQTATENYQATVSRNTRAAEEDQQTIRLTKQSIDKLENSIASDKEDIKAVEEQLVGMRERQAAGILRRRDVEDKERELRGLKEAVTSKEIEVGSLRTSIGQIEQQGRNRDGETEAMAKQIVFTKGKAKRATEIISRVEGRVLNVLKSVGDQVHPNEVVAVVEPISAIVEPVLYVDSKKGKLITADMDVQIVPTDVKREEFGFIRAKVRTVSSFPVTSAEANAAVANDVFVQKLLSEGTKIEVRAELSKCQDTKSGFCWSSGDGPPKTIPSGTELTMSVVAERKRPYTYILPFLKGTIGIS